MLHLGSGAHGVWIRQCQTFDKRRPDTPPRPPHLKQIFPVVCPRGARLILPSKILLASFVVGNCTELCEYWKMFRYTNNILGRIVSINCCDILLVIVPCYEFSIERNLGRNYCEYSVCWKIDFRFGWILIIIRIIISILLRDIHIIWSRI